MVLSVFYDLNCLSVVSLLLSIVKDETTFIRQTCYLKFWRLLFVVTMKRATLT